MSKMDRVNGIDLQFIFKKREHSPETSRLRTEQFKLLQPNRTRIVGKGKDNERILEYRPSQQDRKEIEKLNILNTIDSFTIARNSGPPHSGNLMKTYTSHG